MYGTTLRSLILILLLPSIAIGGSFSILSDTIPPEIITLPTDLTLPCGVPYQQQFDTWIDNHAGLTVSDIGTTEFFNTFQENLEEAIQNSSDTLCGSTAIIPIGFYAIDDCNNVSDTAYANFIIEDTAQPLMMTGASPLSVECDEGIVDSLQNWLDNIGGAVANEVCDGDFSWNNYIWNDNLGNSGFANIGDTTNIEIIRSECEWSVDVTFFVLDDCGNANATTSKFSLIDTTPPMFLNFLTDTVIACVDTIPNLNPIVIDRCDGPLELLTNVESTQGSDPSECNFYNYAVISSYLVSDICGNENSLDQVVQVVDTLAPIIVANQDIIIECDADLTDINTFIDSVIDCAPVETSFTDSLISSSPCSENFIRTWLFVDICGNATEYKQDINVIDQVGPSVDGVIPSLELECSQVGSMEDVLNSFLTILENLQPVDNCGDGELYINNGENPAEISFEFQYTPDLICDGTPIVQQESISITLVDDCGNFEQAISSIRLVDTIAPKIIDCAASQSFQLESGTCDINIPLKTFNVDMQCDSVESIYYFEREIKLDSFNSDSEQINFNWDFSPGDASLLFNDAKIEFSTQGIVNNDLGLEFELTSENGELILAYNEPLSFCDDQKLDFNLDENFTAAWVANGNINFDLNYKIDEFFDCPDQVKIGIKIIIPTLSFNPVKNYYLLDEQEVEIPFQVNDSINLSSGIHRLLYIVEDCAGLRDSCLQTIEIQDLELPELNCPADLNILLPDDACVIDLPFNPAFEFIENCTSNFNFSATLPEANDRFMNFTEQDNGEIVADNIQVNFEGINLDNIILNPVLIVDILANTSNDNGFFSIRDENGETLGSSPQGNDPCNAPQTIMIALTLDQLTEWNMDGSIDFNFVNTNIADGGIAPCSPGDFNGLIDMSSFLTATLAFTEIIPQVVITNEANDTLDLDDGNILLTAGQFTVELTTINNSGNEASCSYNILVEDSTAPVLNCINSEIEIGILDLSLIPDETQINFPIIENCDSLTLDIDAPSVTCEDIGSAISATLVASDQFGNTSSCTFSLDVVGKAIEPSFSSSLCGGDNLTLNNNVAGAGPLSYEWSGPNGFTSEESNPIIDNVNIDDSGIYTLVVETLSGCRFTGLVEVVIDALDVPEIESDDDIVCEGGELILTANDFSDDVLYLWYEGTAPNGSIIGSTALPSITINPSIGPHRYYCIVEGNGCQSEPSNHYNIEVIEHPVALVTESFITACEGESFILSTENTNPTFDFLWTGPNGFMSNDPNPDEIENISIDQQGTYQLVVSDRGCQSDPTNQEVIIFSTPEKAEIAGENVLCEGTDFSLTVTNNASADKYFWYLDGELYNTTNTNSLIILSAQEDIAGSWTVEIEDDNCTSESSDPFIVNIESQLTVGANNNGPICEGGTVTLMASFIPEAIYTWTTPNDQEFSGRVVNVPAVNGVYSVDVITLAGCEGTANTIVEIIQIPEITALSNSALNCMSVGDEINFFPSIFPPGNYDYHWFGPNNFESNEVNPTAIFQGNMSNGVYSLQIRNGNCLSELSLTEVNATLTPPKPVIVQTGALCLGDAINIMASNVGADVEEYIWNTPIGQIINQEPALSISPSSNINIGDYSLTVTVNGCSSMESEPIEVILENSIPAPEISGPSSLCSNQELILQPVNPILDYNYTWLGPDGTNYLGTILNIENFTSADAGNYFLQAESNSCISDFSEPFLVELTSGPASPSLSITEFRFCEGNLSSINIQDFISTPIEGEFILRDDLGMIVATSTDGNFNNLDLSYLDIGFHGFTLNISVADCEAEDPAQLGIYIDPVPAAVSFSTEELNVCNLGVQALDINLQPGASFEIQSNSDIFQVASQTNSQVFINIIDFGQGELILNSLHPTCGIYASQSLIINAISEITANDDEFNIIGISNTMVSILENDIINNLPDVTINNIIGGPILEVNGDMLEINTNGQEGEFEIPYTICDIDCPEVCDEAIIKLNITANQGNEGCAPFNVITPNADNVNDFFEVPCIGNNDQVEVKIFNSFGSLIFHDEDYKNNWSGTYEGQDVEVGTYYYFIKVNSNAPMAGFLVVER